MDRKNTRRGKSKRIRNKGRQLNTYKNKLSALQSRYNHLFKTSNQSKEIYLALEEKDRNPKDKIFFCDKYHKFENFLKVNKLRSVARLEPTRTNYTSKPNTYNIWGK